MKWTTVNDGDCRKIPNKEIVIRNEVNDGVFEYYIGGPNLVKELYENGWMAISYLDEAPDKSLPTDAELQAEAERLYPDITHNPAPQANYVRKARRESWVAGASQYVNRVRELEASLKELDHSFDYLFKMEGVRDAGHRWIEFSDKWQAFKKSLLKHQ
jgi:hypothetical protein